MTRSVDATLAAALAAGAPLRYIKGTIGYSNGNVLNTSDVISYKLTGTTLQMEVPYIGDVGAGQTHIWLERGLQISGVNKTITTGRFFIQSQRYLDNNRQVVTGTIFPKQSYTANGYDTYENVITAFCTYFGKTAVFADAGAAWRGYKFLGQYLGVNKTINLSNAMMFLNMIQQKYLLFACDNGSEQILIYHAGNLGAVDVDVYATADYWLEDTKAASRQYYWKDENGAPGVDGTATNPVHNLGYLESTASPPVRHTPPFLCSAVVRPDLSIMDGDVVQLHVPGGTSVNFFAQPMEQLLAGSKGQPPTWRLVLNTNPIFDSIEGGAQPTDISQPFQGSAGGGNTSSIRQLHENYLALNPSSFASKLSSADTNVQEALNTLDVHQHAYVLGAQGLDGTIAAGVTKYMAPFQSSLTTWANIQYPVGGTLKMLRVSTDSAQPGTGTLVIDVRIDNVATGIQATVPSGGGSNIYGDYTHSAVFPAGHAIQFMIKNNAAGASAQIGGITLEIDS